ncbi:hypothetical protein [Streptomyces sp. NPDC097619]|uniref:hypothetical protein n=1 Tax=Streptomyces sp. NPDC097619 TaxID=3157228 RepID=UPI00332FF738
MSTDPHEVAPLSVTGLPVAGLVAATARARRLLEDGAWRPGTADAEAAARVLARLTAPLPARTGAAAGAAGARLRAEDRERRLQRIWRTTVHHLDAGLVSPAMAALLATVARTLLPWYAAPNRRPAAAAPQYPAAGGAFDRAEPPAPEAGEALLPELTDLFGALAAPYPEGCDPSAPPAEPWRVRYVGRFRHYEKPGPGVWSATTLRCPACAEADGPWEVTCDEQHRTTLGCPCGERITHHGLDPSELLLVLPSP